MYYYKETEKINMALKIAIIVILIAGFIAGIACGHALRIPSNKALEAMQELSKKYSYNRAYWESYLEETVWTLAGTFTMIGIWLGSVVTAFLLYIKKHQLFMFDTICKSLLTTEKNINSEVLQ